MTTYKIDLVRNYPNQSFDISLIASGKNANIRLFQIQKYTYIDIYIDDIAVLLGYAIHNRGRIDLSRWTMTREYLYFSDTLGDSDPDFREYNNRYWFLYEF